MPASESVANAATKDAAQACFDPDCRACERLANHLLQLRSEYPDYFSAPVPAFGDADASLLIVGLAPGLHGANRSGRPFTGDHAGILLYQTLFDCGLSSAPESVAADDGLRLHGCRITNAVKCLPPANKPLGGEVRACNGFLAAELEQLADNSVVFALGGIAHGAVLAALGMKKSAHPFAHGGEHALSRGRILIDSYHCSRYNTQTRRLTAEMFLEVMRRAVSLMPSNRPAIAGP